MQLDEAFAQLNIVQDFIPVGNSNRPGTKLSPTSITIHNTDNGDAGANAAAHAKYQKGAGARKRKVSWHFTVDDKSVYQSLPTNEVGWHAGKRKKEKSSKGNATSIGVEICMNADLDVAAAYQRAALLTAVLAFQNKIKVSDQIKQHHDWSGKNCPRVLRAKPSGWEDFLEQVQQFRTALSDVPAPNIVVNKAEAHHFFDENEPPPDKGTADRKEKIAKPAAMFAKAFVEGAASELALIADEPHWPDLQDFVKFINALNLRHFGPDEFLFLGASNASGKCKGKNTFPPKELWKNITNTALMLDQLREVLDAPIRILSCYRSPAYNACIKGEANSFHKKFYAIDFTCAKGTPETWRQAADKLRSSDSRFVGGIGIYPTSRFVHIDTRGKIANWSGK